MKRIVCIGNGLLAGDTAGRAVHDRLASQALPAGVQVLDGGLGGLGLLGSMDGAEVVVFVDSVRGFAAPGELVVLSPREVVPEAPLAFDHATGLTSLLAVYPRVLEPPLPRVRILGVEEPAPPASIEKAARLALSLALSPAEVAEVAREETLDAQAS